MQTGHNQYLKWKISVGLNLMKLGKYKLVECQIPLSCEVNKYNFHTNNL